MGGVNDGGDAVVGWVGWGVSMCALCCGNEGPWDTKNGKVWKGVFRDAGVGELRVLSVKWTIVVV